MVVVHACIGVLFMRDDDSYQKYLSAWSSELVLLRLLGKDPV